MKDIISKRDWETISAHLDGQLSSRKKIRFDARLNQEIHLQNAFEQLQNTRQILRSTPLVRAPRNFLITPEMAGRTFRMPRLAPIFGWSSAVASFLLILVLIGDIFSGGFVPMAGNIPQQEEFIAPRSQVMTDETLSQPPPTEVIDVPMKGSAEDVAVDNSESDLPLEVAIDPVVETVPSEAPVTESKEIEMFAASEVATPELLDGPTGAAVSGETVLEAPLGESGDQAEQPQEDIEAKRGVDSLTEGESISDTVGIESAQEQPTELQPTEELVTETTGGQPDQLSDDLAAAIPAADHTEEQIEEPSDQTAEMMSEPEPTQIVTPAASETSLDNTSAPEKTRNFVLGAEVILGLCALGTGLAWVYIRRRGSGFWG